MPDKAINAPLSAENIKKNLTKLGATRFELESYVALTDDDIIVPVSALNALRREACEMLETALSTGKATREGFEKYVPMASQRAKKEQHTARFYTAEQITPLSREYFDIIYLPLQNFNGECEGIILPPVILDSEL
jgi:putative protease